MFDRLFGPGAILLVLWLVLVAVVFWFDDAIASAFPRVGGGGDIQRELAMLGQWGQLSSLVILSVCLAALQPLRWRRLLDLWLAAGLVWFVSLLLKQAIGRLRPVHDLSSAFDGWFVRVGEVPPELGSYDLSSFPSSHTSAAVVLSLFIALCWPRLSIFALVMAIIVGFSRITFDAHWVSDVLGGAFVGFLIGYPTIRYFCGVRLLDWMWRGGIDRSASPALDDLVAEERRALGQSA